MAGERAAKALAAFACIALGAGWLTGGGAGAGMVAVGASAAIAAAVLAPRAVGILVLLVVVLVAARALPHQLAGQPVAVRDAPTHLDGIGSSILDTGTLAPHVSGYDRYPVIHLLLAETVHATGLGLYLAAAVLGLATAVALQLAVGAMADRKFGLPPALGMAAFVLMVHAAPVATLYQPMSVAIVLAVLLLWTLDERGARLFVVGTLAGVALSLTHLYTSVVTAFLLLATIVALPVVRRLLTRRPPASVPTPDEARGFAGPRLAIVAIFAGGLLLYSAIVTGQDSYVARLLAPLFGTSLGGYTAEEASQDFAGTQGSRFFRLASNVANLFVPATTLYAVYHVWRRRRGLVLVEGFSFTNRLVGYASNYYAPLLPSRILAIGAPGWSVMGALLLLWMGSLRRRALPLTILGLVGALALTGYDALNHESLWHGREPFPRPYAEPAIDIAPALNAWKPMSGAVHHLTQHTRSPLDEDIVRSYWHWPPADTRPSVWILDAASLDAPVELGPGYGETRPPGTSPVILPGASEVGFLESQGVRMADFGGYTGWALAAVRADA